MHAYDFFFIAASFGFFCRVSDLVVNMWLIYIYIYIYIYIILIAMPFFLTI
jgi:hypothetical protein